MTVDRKDRLYKENRKEQDRSLMKAVIFGNV